MTAQSLFQSVSRPVDIPDLIDRLTNRRIDAPERDALQALCRTAVHEVLDCDSIPRFNWEAAQLAQVLPKSDYTTLLRNFVNSIANGTEDGTSLDPVHLRCLAFVVRLGEGKFSSGSSPLGPLLSSLKRRLESVRSQGDQEAQYELMCIMGLTLDAMVDVGASNLSRADLHKPLLRLLQDLSEETELHLAQAACYARQALLSISDNDTLWDASLRGILRTIDLTMMTVGAAGGHDPQKIYEAVKAAIEGGMKLKDYAWDAFKARTGKSWYTALRTTNILIRTVAFKELEAFITHADCRGKTEFLCGLYAQLEQARNLSSAAEFEWIYSKIPASKNSRVQAWAQFSTLANDKPQTVATRSKNRIAAHLNLYDSKKAGGFKWSLITFRWESGSSEGSFEASANTTTGSSLMDHVFPKCDAARRYYTRNALLQHYYKNDNECLRIQRLAGRPLPMDKCYINLAVVNASKSQSHEEISLRKLFGPDKQTGRRMMHSKRVLIEGQAGIGKTTLCKKIVHDYLYEGQWNDDFEWLLWVPLRNLRGRSNSSTSYWLEDLCRDEYFSQHADRDVFAETLRKEVTSGLRGGRVLFILDGLDEISRDWAPDTLMDRFLQNLLQQPQVIITSRPYNTSRLDRRTLDLELKTIGFSSDQIVSYVRAPEITPDEKTSSKICSFIREHPRLRNFAQIPILLDVLCYVWNESLGNKIDSPRTMTELYGSMTVKLLKKDMCRLRKQYGQKELTEEDVEDLSNSEVEDFMQAEMNMLEALAFHGFLNETFEFDVHFRSRVCECLRKQGFLVPRLYDTTLKGLSFLRTSDTSLENNKQSFHFLHRTVQEYFAARYFARCWLRSVDLPYIIIGQKGKDGITHASPLKLLQDEKYNIGYDIIWRFVGGLLHSGWKQATTSIEPLIEYFRALEAEPRDLLGPAHLHVMMRCLSEIQLSDDEPPGFGIYRQRIEDGLMRWSPIKDFFVHHSYYSPLTFDFVNQAEFPEHLLYSLLRDGPIRFKESVMGVFRQRQYVSPPFLNLISSWVDEYSDDGSALKKLSLQVLFSNAEHLPEKALSTLVNQISEDDVWVKIPQLRDPSFQSNLPPRALQAMLSRLGDGNTETREQAVTILTKQPTLGPIVLKSLAERLNDDVPIVRLAAVMGLRRQPKLAQDILNSLLRMLSDKDYDVRHTAAQALGNQISLPLEVLYSMFDLLKLGDNDTKMAVTFAASLQRQLPTPFLDALVQQLGTDNEPMRRFTAFALASISSLPPEIADSLAKKLNDEKISSRQGAVRALGLRKSLSARDIDILALRLRDESADVRKEVAGVLARHRVLAPHVIDSIAERLLDEDTTVRQIAAAALGSQLSLPEEKVDYMLQCLQDETNYFVKISIIRALHRPLSPEKLKLLFEFLLGDNRGNGLAQESIEYLAKAQPFLPTEILYRLADKLDDDEKDGSVLKVLYLRALGSRSDLPPDILVRIAKVLKHDGLSQEAAEILHRQSIVPRETIPYLAGAVRTYPVAYVLATNILSRQAVIPEHIIRAMCFNMRFGDGIVSTIRALKSHKSFYVVLLQMGLNFNFLSYQCFLTFSSDERWAFYYRNGSFLLELPEGRKEIRLNSYQTVKFLVLLRSFSIVQSHLSAILVVLAWMTGHQWCLLFGLVSIATTMLVVLLLWLL